MDDITFEPDLGQQGTFEVNDLDDTIYNAYEKGRPVFLGDIKVKVLAYNSIRPLGYNPGCRAKITCERVA